MRGGRPPRMRARPSGTCIARIFVCFGRTKLYSLAHAFRISKNSLRNLIKSASSPPAPRCETAAEELAASCSRSDPKAGGDARLQKNDFRQKINMLNIQCMNKTYLQKSYIYANRCIKIISCKYHIIVWWNKLFIPWENLVESSKSCTLNVVR